MISTQQVIRSDGSTPDSYRGARVQRTSRRGAWARLGSRWLATLLAVSAAAATARAQTVLILDGTVVGGTASREAVAAVAAGMTVEMCTNAQWSAKTTAQFAAYRAIILGDPIGDLNAATTTVENTVNVWGPAVTGNVVIIGTDPANHGGGATELIEKGILFAIDDAANTGMFVALSHYYDSAPPNTPVPMLDGLDGGGFQATSTACSNIAHIVAVHPALAGLTDADLSGWGCSIHEGITQWPPSFRVLAVAVQANGVYTAPDGVVGMPYIIARGQGLTTISGIALAPPLTVGVPIGATRVLTATVTEDGLPIASTNVQFSVNSGPNAGLTGSDTTDALGQAEFSYASTSAGNDFTTADCLDSTGATLVSNQAEIRWIVPPAPCLCGAPTWSDTFDGYALASAVEGQGSWDTLCGSNTPSVVSALHSVSPPHSVAVSRTSDLVQTFSGYTSGQWVFQAQQYLPSATFSESTWFRMLHFHGGSCFPFSGPHQSVEIEFDASSAQWKLYQNCSVAAVGPLFFDQWVELRVEVDLDANLVRTFYGGTQMGLTVNYYAAGACPAPAGPIEIQAVKFSTYGVNPLSKAFYDCMSLGPYVPPVTITVAAGGSTGLTVPKVVAIDPDDHVVGVLPNALAHTLDGGGRVASHVWVWFTDANPTTGPSSLMASIAPPGGPDTEICMTMASSLNGVYPYEAEVLDQNLVSLCAIDPELVAGTNISIYCTPKVNSVGCAPAMQFEGAPSPSFGSGFTLSATNVLNNKFGLLFYGTNGPAAIAFQGGTLCVTPPIKRTTVQSSNGNPPPNDCSGTFAFDFNAHIATGLDPALGSGTTVNAQYWYRDPGFAPPNNTGLTNAIQFTIP